MAKPMFNAVKKHAKGEQTIVFVADRRQARLTALDLLTFAAADDQPKFFMRERKQGEEIDISQFSESTLKDVLKGGIAFLHDGLSDAEVGKLKRLFKNGLLGALVVSHNLCWTVGDLESHLVVILDAHKYDGHAHRHVEYDIADVL